MVWRLAPYVAMLLIGGGVLGWAYLAGRGDVEQEIEEQNNDATVEAFRADLGYLECVDGGFVWDFGAGQCRRRETGAR